MRVPKLEWSIGRCGICATILLCLRPPERQQQVAVGEAVAAEDVEVDAAGAVAVAPRLEKLQERARMPARPALELQAKRGANCRLNSALPVRVAEEEAAVVVAGEVAVSVARGADPWWNRASTWSLSRRPEKPTRGQWPWKTIRAYKCPPKTAPNARRRSIPW
jgi:hypothetical protein